jgi:hypothetical protein
MEYIISNPVTVEKIERTRAPQIYITNPYVGDTGEISFSSERLVLLDGQPVAALPAIPVIRRVNAVVADMFTVTDPVTQQSVTISVAGIAEAIGAAYCRWYAADRAAEAQAEAARLAAAGG